MTFHLLFLSCCSASFELDNFEIYYSSQPYDVFLNGEQALSDVKTNVFSLWNLKDDTEYLCQIGDDRLKFHTAVASLTLLASQLKKEDSADDTLLLQSAIGMLPPQGHLVLDQRDYHVTSLFLKSHITIEIKKGARLLGSPDVNAYPLFPGEVDGNDGAKKIQFLTWEGGPLQGKPSLVNGFFLEDVQLVGEGTIDGQADRSMFWQDVKHLSWARPRILYFNHCRDVFVQGLTLQNSPSWTIHPYFSQQLGFYDLFIKNPKDTPNTDGLNPECCSEVKIVGIHFSVGDDCIAIKSGKLYIGQTYQTPSERIFIRNCYMEEGHGAVVLGSEAGAGIKELQVERCLFERTDRGVRIKSRRGRGKESRIDNVVFRDIRMINVLTPLVINMFYFCDPDGKDDWVQDKAKRENDETTPYLGNFTFERFTCEDCEWALGVFYGLPEQPIASVTIKDSSFTVKTSASKGLPAMMCGLEESSRKGFQFVNVKSVSLINVKAKGFLGNEEILENVGSFKKV
jgi:polygalacturonase